VDLSFLFWLFFLGQFFVPLYQKQALQLRRERSIRGLQDRRHTRVITMIHRQETMNFLGFPIARYIDIEDSEKILRAIRLTSAETPIDLVLHTPGGLVLAAEQIASALQRHQAAVTVFVPHYAMSGGTLIALAADTIVMDPNAVLGPIDPQLGMGQGSVAAASIIKALSQPNPNRDDQTLILGDLAEKAIRQVKATAKRLLLDHHPEAEADRIATTLSSGVWTHDYPLQIEELRDLGFTVRDDMPREVYDLMELYPQSTQQRPGVEFLPLPYAPPARDAPTKNRR
jgi:ClpP class serine protease